MQSNSSCSACSREATYCCLCLSARVYLCEVCLPQHTSKTGVLHLVASASLPLYVDKSNLEDYYRRAAVVRKVRENVEVACTYLAEEQDKLDQVCIAFHEEMKQILHETCYKVYEDISAHYKSLKAELETFRQELTREEEGTHMSQTSLWYVEKGLHVTQSCVFINIEGELRRRIKVSAGPAQLLSLQQTIEAWGTTPCECSDCIEARELFKKPEEDNYWTCQGCNFAQNSLNSCICATCKVDWSVQSHTPPRCSATVQEIQPAQPEYIAPTPIYWTCTECHYTRNPISLGTCVSCRIPSAQAQLQWLPPRPHYYQTVQETGSQPASSPLIANPDPPLANIPRGSTWSCDRCRKTNSSLKRDCQHCGWLPSSELPPAKGREAQQTPARPQAAKKPSKTAVIRPSTANKK